LRFYFLSPTSATAKNISRLRKSSYEIRRIMIESIPRKTLDKLIVLCNGTPDDRVLGVLAYHLNGNNIVGITKPIETRLGALGLLASFLNYSTPLRFKKFLFLIDQETDLPDDLFINAETIMENSGITFIVDESFDRGRSYNCSVTGGREFEVVVVVNGLDDIPTTNHCIEDHLAKAKGLRVRGKSKDAWAALSSEEQRLVFRNLKGSVQTVEQLFPQQVHGCRILERSR